MKKVEEIEDERGAPSSFYPIQKPRVISQLSDGVATPFLPCHYFDLIGGTSTGALIAIMLSQFRMTVEDCLEEYKKMGTDIFGHPRRLHAINVPIITRTRFSTGRLTRAFEQVIERRSEAKAEPSASSLANFKTEAGTCRGLALSITDGQSELVCHMRSYERPDINPCPWTVLEAARAATAAPLYFKPVSKTLTEQQVLTLGRAPTLRRMDSSTRPAAPRRTKLQLMDAGFGMDNNPCEVMFQEMKTMSFGSPPTVVSIGTARPGHPEGEGRQRTLRSTVKRAFRTLGGPERGHMKLENLADEGGFPYFRFNAPNGLSMEMDEWNPKRNGSRTIEKMQMAFNEWIESSVALEGLKDCAQQLVRVRRERARDGTKWAQYAVGRYFACDDNSCYQQGTKFPSRSSFERHLMDHPGGRERIEREEGIEAVVRRAEREWRYQPAA
ncbi:FabD/lysophospholipase-like protein [Apiospora sp. TS-2023a]